MVRPTGIHRNGATREIVVVELEWRGDLAVVQTRGELDLVSVEVLRGALDGIGAARSLLVDLRGLSFIDSSGLHLLVELHERATREGIELHLVAPPAPVDTPIRLCGLDRHLSFVDLPVDGLAA